MEYPSFNTGIGKKNISRRILRTLYNYSTSLSVILYSYLMLVQSSINLWGTGKDQNVLFPEPTTGGNRTIGLNDGIICQVIVVHWP